MCARHFHLPVAIPEHHQAFRRFVGERSQQDAVDDTENSGAASDRKCESEHNHKGITAVLAQIVNGVTELIQHLIE